MSRKQSNVFDRWGVLVFIGLMFVCALLFFPNDVDHQVDEGLAVQPAGYTAVGHPWEDVSHGV